MLVELLKFWTKDGLKMHGLLSRSRKRNTTVILDIFGMCGDFFSPPKKEALYKMAHGTKIDVFFAGNRGLGSIFSFTDKKGKQIFLGTALERFEDCVYDIQGAIKLMKTLGYKKIILLGSSTGCEKAVYYQYKMKDNSVNGIVLLAPVDDYNIVRRELGSKFRKAVRIAKKMVREGRSQEITPNWISYYSAARFLSYAQQDKPEARLFNYDSNLTEFRSIKCPIFVVFGSDDLKATKPVKEHISILFSVTSSKHFSSAIIDGADHGFKGKEKQLANAIIKWSIAIASA